MTGTELASAVLMGLKTVVLVFNNGGWGAIANLQDELFGAGRELDTKFRRPSGERYYADIAGVAAALGCHAERVEAPGDLAPALERALAASGPALVEAMTEPELPWSAIQGAGEWDITVPANVPGRAQYIQSRGF